MYVRSSIYRKIYEQTVGPIPKDANGRTFEIHHIDGNRRNNDPTNLIAVSIEEHYAIHKRQGDKAACARIASRMNISPEERVILCQEAGRESAKKMLADGTFNMLGGEIQRRTQLKHVNDGDHSFLTTHDCPNCGRSGKGPWFKANHFDNCKFKASILKST